MTQPTLAAALPEARARRWGPIIGVGVALVALVGGVVLLRPGPVPAADPLRPPEVVVPKPETPPPPLTAPTALIPEVPVPEPPPAAEPRSASAAPARRTSAKSAERAPEKATDKAAASASKMGHVTVSGDASHVSLVSGGRTLAPGDVPAGTYTVMAIFEGGEATAAGVVDVKAGETTRVYCSAAFSRCGIR